MDIFKGIGDFLGGLFGGKKKREEEQTPQPQQQSAVSFNNSTPKFGSNFANGIDNTMPVGQPKELGKSTVDFNQNKPQEIKPVQPVQPQNSREQERQQLSEKYRQEETDRYNQGADHGANFLNDIFSGGKTAKARELTINQNIQNRVNAEMLRKYGPEDQKTKQNIATTSQNINKNASAVSNFTNNYNNNVQQTVATPVSAVKGAANSVVETVPRVSGAFTELGANTIKLFDENNQFANNLIDHVRKDREKNIVRKTLNDATGLTNQDNKLAYGLGSSGTRMAIDAAMTPVTGGVVPAVVHGVEAHSDMMDNLDNIETRKKAEAEANGEIYTPSNFKARYLASTANAGVQAAIEKLGMDNITGKIGGKFAQNIAGRAITGALGEAGEEAAQQYAENLTKKLFDRNQDIHEGVAESALMGGIMGGVGKMAFGGMNDVKNPYRNSNMADGEVSISKLHPDQMGYNKDALLGKLNGDTRKRMSERSFNTLQDLRANNPYMTGDGQEIYLSGKGNKKFVNTQAGIDAEFVAKMRSTPRINKLIQKSEYSHTSPDTKNHGIAPDGFDYRDVNFKYGGKDFNTTFNVAKNNTIDRNTLYGATTKENISTPGLRDNPSTKSYADVSIDRLSQNTQKVNDNTLNIAKNNQYTTLASDRDFVGRDFRGENSRVNKIINRPDGSRYVEIDNNITDGLSNKKDISGAVRKHITDNFQGNQYKVGSTDSLAKVTAKTKAEISHQQKVMNDIDYAVKARMAGNLNDIIETMTDIRVVENKKPRNKPNISHYLSGRTEVDIDGEVYYPRVDIEVGKNGNVVAYDIADIKKEPRSERYNNHSYMWEANSTLDNQGSAYGSNISQNDRKVNNIKYKLVEQNKDLLATHTLTADKLKATDAMGGAIYPSIAISKPEVFAGEGYGNITLVGGKDFIDPKNRQNKVKVFDNDIYSPRVPKPDYKVKNIPNEYKEMMAKTNYDPSYLLNYPEDVIGSGLDSKIYRDSYMANKTGVDNITKVPSDKYSEYLKEDIFNKPEYRDYAKKMHNMLEIEKRLLMGETSMGNAIYKPYTSENILKKMNKSELKGGERSYSLSPDYVYAAEELKNIKAIKNKQDLLQKIDIERLGQIRDKNRKIADKIEDALREQGMYFYQIKEKIADYLNTGNTEGLTAKSIALLDAYKQELDSDPRLYFEAKMRRMVGLDEFKKAVIPDNLDDETRAILKNRGVETIEYKAGDNADRMAKLNALDDLKFKKMQAENLVRVAKENLQARHQELTGDQSIAFNEWANELERRAQGFFDEKTGKITINDGDLNTLNHELGHKLLSRADNRTELLADIRNTVGDEALNAKYGENYAQQVANMNLEERANLFAEEYLADGFSDYYNGILAGGDSQRLGAKLGIPPKVLATYDRIVEAIKGILGLQQDTLKQFYAQAETGKFARNYKQNTPAYNENPAYKITQDSKGDLVEIEQNIFEGVPRNERAKTLRKYLQQNLQGNEYGLNYDRDGNVRITRDSTYKISNPQQNAFALGKKGEMISELPDILTISQKTGWVPDGKDHSFARDGFEYRQSRVKLGDEIYTVNLNVGLSQNGKVLYEINDIKKEPPITGANSSFESGDSSNIQSISQNQNNVKYKIKNSDFERQLDYIQARNNNEKTTAISKLAEQSLEEGEKYPFKELAKLAGNEYRAELAIQDLSDFYLGGDIEIAAKVYNWAKLGNEKQDALRELTNKRNGLLAQFREDYEVSDEYDYKRDEQIEKTADPALQKEYENWINRLEDEYSEKYWQIADDFDAKIGEIEVKLPKGLLEGEAGLNFNQERAFREYTK